MQGSGPSRALSYPGGRYSVAVSITPSERGYRSTSRVMSRSCDTMGQGVGGRVGENGYGPSISLCEACVQNALMRREHRGTVDSAPSVLYPCLRVRVRVVGDLALGGFELQTAPCCCSGCARPFRDYRRPGRGPQQGGPEGRDAEQALQCRVHVAGVAEVAEASRDGGPL